MSEGILDQISLGAESVVGTAVTPSVSIAVLPSDGVVIEQEPVAVEGINGSPAKNKDFVSGIREYNGSFEMNAYPVAMGYVLNSALGDTSSALYGSETTVYKHTITETVTKPSLTLEQRTGGITERYAGFTAGGFTLSINVGEPCKLSFEGKALSHASETAISGTYETTKVFDWTDIQSITLGGTDIKCAIKELSIEYTNDLNNFHGLCSQPEPSNLYIKSSEVKGKISGYLDSNLIAQQTAFENTTAQELIITIIGDETIGNGSNNSLTITLSKVVLSSYKHPIDTEYVALEADFEGAEDATNGLIKVELINTQDAY